MSMPLDHPRFWQSLDPGIRDVVRILIDAGFHTTDSGDGVSKPDVGRVLDVPHVFCVVAPGDLVAEADRAVSVMAAAGVAADVQGVYVAADRVGLVEVYPAR